MRRDLVNFVNWAGTVRTTPAAWHAPASEDELASLVRHAEGRRLRVVGAGHSWSAVAAPEDLAISLDGLRGVVKLEADQLTVHGGTRLHQLNAALRARGLALPILGSVAEQSIAGAIATGTHGSSLVHGNLSSLVRGLRLIDGRGEAHELGPGDARLDGARVHVGALGVITQVTLAVVPAFNLAETVTDLPLGQAIRELPALAASAEYCKVWWLPHTRSVQVFRLVRTDERAQAAPAVVRFFDNRIMHTVVFPAALRLGRVPGVTRVVNHIAAHTLRRPRRVGPSPLMLSTPMPARHRETEAAVPLARASEAFDRVVRLIARERLPVNFLFELRFVRGDGGWLSPAYGGDVCQLGAYCYGPATDRYFAGFWRELAELGARPHWGKELTRLPDIHAMWPRAADFVALRDALDPERRFGSSLHASLFGA